MIKISKDNTVLSDSEVDEITLLLEALHGETGNMKVFLIIEILMKETIETIKSDLNK